MPPGVVMYRPPDGAPNYKGEEDEGDPNFLPYLFSQWVGRQDIEDMDRNPLFLNSHERNAWLCIPVRVELLAIVGSRKHLRSSAGVFCLRFRRPPLLKFRSKFHWV